MRYNNYMAVLKNRARKEEEYELKMDSITNALEFEYERYLKEKDIDKKAILAKRWHNQFKRLE